MRAYLRFATGAVSALTVAGLLAGCGESGSSGTKAPEAGPSGAGCAPIAGEQLVVLEDDKKLQNADNIIAAVHAKAASPELLAAVNKVAEALDTPKLIQLNKAVVIDRRTPKVTAEEFATANNLTAGIVKGGGGKLIVGVADFSESETLGELYRIVLTAAGYQATVQQIGNRELYAPALRKGDIHVVPEYAASMADYLAGQGFPATSDPDVDKTVTSLKAAQEKAGLVFGAPAAAQDQNAFAVTKAFADKYGLRTISDLAAKCSGQATVLAGPPECPQRPKCQAGLESVYQFRAGSFSSLDAGGPQTKSALRTGAASVGLVFSSDGALAVG